MIIQKPDIRILTYNIFLRPYGIKTNGDDFKTERLELFATEMTKYDIVCLQEVFDNFTHRQSLICDRAEERGFKYMARSPAPGLAGRHLIDGGLIVFSKLPIAATDFYEFKCSIFSDALTAKGVLYLHIELPEGALHVFTTHDQAHYQNGDKVIELANHYVRLQQLVEAKNFINRKLETVMDKGDTAIFLGDLNVDANCSEYPLKEAQVLFTNEFCYEEDYQQLTSNEYDLLLYILNNKRVWFPCLDVFYKQHAKFFATYGDMELDQSGRKKPKVT